LSYQWETNKIKQQPLIEVTLGQRETDNFNRIVTLSKLSFPLSEAIFRKQGLLKLPKIEYIFFYFCQAFINHWAYFSFQTVRFNIFLWSCNKELFRGLGITLCAVENNKKQNFFWCFPSDEHCSQYKVINFSFSLVLTSNHWKLETRIINNNNEFLLKQLFNYLCARNDLINKRYHMSV